MPWTLLTYDGLRDRLGSTESEALLAESPTPESKVEDILTQIAADVVSRVNAGRRKRGLAPAVNTGRYVPPGSVRHAYTLAVRLLTDSFPSLSEYNGEDRRAAIDEARDHLNDLANNNADSDDAGGDSFIATAGGGSFRTGGKELLDFIGTP